MQNRNLKVLLLHLVKLLHSIMATKAIALAIIESRSVTTPSVWAGAMIKYTTEIMASVTSL